MINDSQIKSLFAKHGVRCTKQRLDLYRSLHATDSHPNAEELHSLVREEAGPGTSLATVYNTLEAFSKAGLVKRIPTPGSGTRYDAAMHDHLHVITDEGRVFDLKSDQLTTHLGPIPEVLRQQVEQLLGVPVKRLEVQLVAAS